MERYQVNFINVLVTTTLAVGIFKKTIKIEGGTAPGAVNIILCLNNNSILLGILPSKAIEYKIFYNYILS